LLVSFRILRKEESTSDVHFFSTQFFEKIQEQGVQSVANWTKRRKINIFEKKFILIPINDALHWSLCVIVNAGMIGNAYFHQNENEMDVDINEQNVDLYNDSDPTLDAPFLLLLDSLKAHDVQKVKTHIYNWLNFEAKRLNIFQGFRENGPFWRTSMPLFQPKGKM